MHLLRCWYAYRCNNLHEYSIIKTMKHLVLIGGGHAHLAVLSALAKQQNPQLHLTLITPQPQQTYSGMLPGWLAGHYSLDECQINLPPLLAAAQGQWLLDQVTRLNPAQQTLETAEGRIIHYDLLSINIGSETALAPHQVARLIPIIPIRPLERLISTWPSILKAAQQHPYQLAVLGGGAAGVELALAIQYAFQQQAPQATVHLIAPSLLADHSLGVQKRVQHRLLQAGVHLHLSRASLQSEYLELANGEQLHVEHIIAATGAKAPDWLANSGLSLDEQGYIAVNAHHQSLSHASIFAAGDICSRVEPQFKRSGVHAVYAGKLLAYNLPAFINHQPLKIYQPKQRSLYLLATGPKQAIASWGAWSAEGAWVWRWKNYIDQKFMQQYRLLTSTLKTSEQPS